MNQYFILFFLAHAKKKNYAKYYRGSFIRVIFALPYRTHTTRIPYQIALFCKKFSGFSFLNSIFGKKIIEIYQKDIKKPSLFFEYYINNKIYLLNQQKKVLFGFLLLWNIFKLSQIPYDSGLNLVWAWPCPFSHTM